MSPKSIRSIVLLITASLAVSMAALAQPQPLQIRGRFIGQDVTEACAGAPIESSMDDIVKGIVEANPTMKLTHSSSCDVSIPTFAGQIVSGVGQLLFVRDKLIQLKFELEPMDWGPAVDFFNVMDQAYGKTKRPVLDKYGVFNSKTWQRKGQSMTLSWPVTKEGGFFHIEVTLSDTQAMKEFWKVYDHNKKQLDAAIAKDRVNDTK